MTYLEAAAHSPSIQPRPPIDSVDAPDAISMPASLRKLAFLPSPRPVKQRTRVVIADEHAIVRDGLRMLLASNPAIEIVAEAADGHTAIDACRQHRPDILVTDLQLPSLDGLEVARTVRRRWADTRILVLTGTLSEARAADTLDAGAHGYLLKHSGYDKLCTALQAMAVGLPFIDSSLDVAQLNALREQKGKSGSESRVATLTNRERQVLKLIAEGERNSDIATRLSISKKTVETHRLNLMQKLDAHNVAELVKWACRLGLMSLS